MRLSDGTQALYRSDSTIEPASQFPNPRRIIVDGDVYLIVPAAADPLIVSSRLLLLTVSGRSALRITAFARQSGEHVQVLCGEVVARKHYASTCDAPDHLSGGKMTMVNQSIDLMEKETFSPLELGAWAAGIGAEPLDLSCRSGARCSRSATGVTGMVAALGVRRDVGRREQHVAKLAARIQWRLIGEMPRGGIAAFTTG